MKDIILRAIAVLGLIAVLLLGAWGIIQLAVRLPSFFSAVGDYFSRDRGPEETPEVVATSTPPAIATTTPAQPEPSKPASSGPTKGSSKGSTTYVPAQKGAVYLWGYPDLSVRMLSAMPQGGRVTVSFEISNIGTNAVGAGWYFNAMLPWQGYGQSSYTWSSSAQQALNPGDRIVYALTFDAPYGGGYGGGSWGGDQYCIAIYPPPPGCYGNPPYGNQPHWGNRTATIVADPQNRVYETNEFNNTASIGF